jgi:hypothetical protein
MLTSSHAFRLLLTMMIVVGLAQPSGADPATRSTLGWAINGIVSEVARAGDVAYVGGAFDTVSPAPNQVTGFSAFAADSATPVLPALDVNGRVRAVAALPGGGWLVGGEFTQVNGVSRQRLVRLLASGAVDPTFTLAANQAVWTLLVSGSRVYVGGEFTTLGGAPRLRLAALDATTLALDVTFAPTVEGSSTSVCTLAVSGGTLYFGGRFTQVNGASQDNLGAVNATTGVSLAGFVGETDNRVNELVVSGTALFVAGEFQNAGGAARQGIAKLVASTGLVDAAFNANADGLGYSLAVSGSSVFVSGTFDNIGGQTRSYLAQLDTTTGAASAWHPNPSNRVHDVALVGTVLLVTGDFDDIGGVDRLYLAALDTTRTTGMTLTWNPSLNDGADTIEVDAAGTVFVSGWFEYFGAVRRSNLAAIDLLTGELLSFNPGTNGWVRGLDVLGNRVFVGGDFTTIGGVSRSRIAELDGVTGVVSSWTANPNAPVKGLMVFGDAVYFVGDFTQVKNSTSRGRGAAVALDGTVLPWNPAADALIESLYVTETRTFLGGEFLQLGGEAHSRLGAVSTTTGAPITAFAPTVSGRVIRVDAQDDIVFFGGDFSQVNGSTRNNAAAVQSAPGMPADGILLGWNPNIGGPVYDIDAFGADVYFAGGFSSVGGESRPGIAMTDALPTGGAVRAWEPEDVGGGSISVIDTSTTAVLFGGLMYDTNNVQIGAVLYPLLGLPGVPPPPTTPEVLVRGSRLTLAWTPPPLGARPTTYVIEGGSGPGQRNLANFSTGSTGTTFTADGLAAGTYYLRMRSANASGVGAAGLEQAFVVGAAGCSAPPAAPLDLRATVSGTSVTLTWASSPQSIVGSYRVLAGSASGVANLGTFDVGSVLTYTTTAPTGAYFVRVQAVNNCGQGVPTPETVAVVGGAPVPPGPVFGLQGTVTGNTVSLQWGPPSVGSTPFQYRVEAGSAPGLANLAAITVTNPAFVTTGVPAGLYYVRVRAISAFGMGPAGNEIVVVVP